jgi:anti-sigma regulatory factor (Ser/Thr protein kinase)
MKRVGAAEDRLWLGVDEVATSGAVRRAAVSIGAEAGLDETRLANLAIVATEIATNAARHADRGAILLRLRRSRDATGVELVAIDHGPGMADVAASRRDGVSTAGTLGIGLGAIGRLADDLDIYSVPERGTVLVALKWNGPAEVTGPAGLTRPIPGEEVCGDGFAARELGGVTQLFMSDGLGHGALAAWATQAAVEAFLAAPAGPPAEVLAYVSAHTRHTRGAVAAVAELGPGLVRFAGIGNIGASVTDGDTRKVMVSMPGIVGQQHRGIRGYDYPAGPDSLVVLHSDGVSDRWTLADYPGLPARRPLVIAATLLRDAGRRRDDAAVMVARTP